MKQASVHGEALSHKPHGTCECLRVLARRRRARHDGCAFIEEERQGEVCMRGVLPVPSWLIPHWLLRWVAPIFFSKIIPLFIRLGQRFETPSAATASDSAQQFVRRVTADADGFYASAAKAGLVPEEQLQAFTKAAAASNAEETGLIDAGIAQPSPRGPSSALREARRMRVAVEIIG